MNEADRLERIKAAKEEILKLRDDIAALRATNYLRDPDDAAPDQEEQA